MSGTAYNEWFNIYYSQNGEDLVLRSFFPHLDNGFYIDVGAQDPDKFSVTKMFYELGWNGVNIEPQDSYFKLLEKKRPRDINLRVVLASQKGSLTFREYPEATGLSTVSESMMSDYENDHSRLASVTKKYREYPVEAITLKDIFIKYASDKTVNFLKIDVEGFEAEVLKGNDWKKFRPQVLCIESNHIKEAWSDILSSAHYKEFLFDGLNRYYVAEESLESLSAKFDYATTALSKIPLNKVPYNVFVHDINKLNTELAKLNKLLKKQDQFIKTLDLRLAERDQELVALRSRKWVKGSVYRISHAVKTATHEKNKNKD